VAERIRNDPRNRFDPDEERKFRCSFDLQSFGGMSTR
jgi:hypothetical protein